MILQTIIKLKDNFLFVFSQAWLLLIGGGVVAVVINIIFDQIRDRNRKVEK